jgi:hypothetical protein
MPFSGMGHYALQFPATYKATFTTPAAAPIWVDQVVELAHVVATSKL